MSNHGQKRIEVYEGDTVDKLVADFREKCPIDDSMAFKLAGLLQEQMDNVLDRIDEDEEIDEE